MRAALYARYSTDLQRDTSLDDQVTVGRAYAQQHGWRIDTRHVYTDAAVSGASLEGRAGLAALLRSAATAPRPFDVLLVDDSSRISRDLADALRVMQQLRFAGVRVIYISQGIDSASEQADILVAVHGIVDGLYLRELAAKTRRGLAGQAERGYATGSKTYGYRTVPVLDPGGRADPSGHPVLLGKALVVEESEAENVRRVFEWYAAGLGVGGIVRRLNHAEPGQWKPGRVRRMLANERYRGRQIWNQRRFERRPGTRQKVARPLPAADWKVYERPDLRIIADDLWRRVQARREEVRAIVPASGRLRGRVGALFSRHLFTGYMRCGECGGAFTSVSGGHGSSRYGCPAAWNSGTTVCGNRLTIRASVVDPALLSGLQAALLEPTTIQRITDALARQLNQVLDHRPALRASRLAARDVLARKIANLVTAVESGASSPALVQALAAREADLRGLEAELAQLDDASPLRDRLAVMPHWVRQQVAQVADLLRDVPERAKQEFRRLGVSFTVSPVRDEGERPFLRAVGITEFSAILAGSGNDFTPTVRSRPR